MSADKRTPSHSAPFCMVIYGFADLDICAWIAWLVIQLSPTIQYEQEVSYSQKDSCACVYIFKWIKSYLKAASKIHLPFTGCIQMSTVLSKRVHSLFWCRISPAVSSKPYPLSCSKADRMTKKTLVLTNFVSPFDFSEIVWQVSLVFI